MFTAVPRFASVRPPAPSTIQRSTGQRLFVPTTTSSGDFYAENMARFFPFLWRKVLTDHKCEVCPKNLKKRVPSVVRAAHDLHRPPKAFLSQLSSHLPHFRVPASTSVRMAHPRLRLVADGGAIMGPQVSLTGGLCVGLPPFPPSPFPSPREMHFAFQIPCIAIRSAISFRRGPRPDLEWAAGIILPSPFSDLSPLAD
jgi:hypothetical protein